MLAYGGGSVKKNGIYDEISSILCKMGKKIVDFPGIMSNPTYAKVQEGSDAGTGEWRRLYPRRRRRQCR